jgi:hypothetical protein
MAGTPPAAKTAIIGAGVLPDPDEASERNGHSDRSVRSPMIQPVAASPRPVYAISEDRWT